MGDLARKHSVRTLGFAPTALWAVGTALLAVFLLIFFLGFCVGVSSVKPLHQESPTWMMAETREESLSELLARVEASSSPKESLEELTYPDALSGQMEAADQAEVPEDASEAPGLTLKGKENVEAFADSSRPTGAFTVEITHVTDVRLAAAIWEIVKERHADSWVLTERTEGLTIYRVVVGSHGRESQAEAAKEDLTKSIEELEIPVQWTFEVRSVMS